MQKIYMSLSKYFSLQEETFGHVDKLIMMDNVVKGGQSVSTNFFLLGSSVFHLTRSHSFFPMVIYQCCWPPKCLFNFFYGMN